MKAPLSELMTKAKLVVDLPGFLGAHGFGPTATDDARWRVLAGPDGRRVLVHQARSGDWLWQDSATGEAGNIYHACTALLGMTHGKAIGVIRQVVTTPPSALPVRRLHASAPSVTVSTNTGRPQGRPPRTLVPLTPGAADFLTGTRCLDESTVAAFAHRLRSHPHGSWLVCPHNNDGDGEEYQPQADGSTKKHFHGSRDDGSGRGRSLWHAHSRPSEVPQYALIAESVIDAMSAWQRLDAETQARTEIVSTAGSLSEAGQRKLSRLIRGLQQQCVQTYRIKLVLLDASDVGEATTDARTGKLEALAAFHGLKYQRWATPVGKDWNDAVVAERRALKAQIEQEACESHSATNHSLPSEDHTLSEEQSDENVTRNKRSRR